MKIIQFTIYSLRWHIHLNINRRHMACAILPSASFKFHEIYIFLYSSKIVTYTNSSGPLSVDLRIHTLSSQNIKLIK